MARTLETRSVRSSARVEREVSRSEYAEANSGEVEEAVEERDRIRR